MSSAWLLPEHIADVLPAQARAIEELRRELLDMARTYGCELVMPPMLEHLESLLSGTGHALDLKTFKLVDQLSGRSLGLRADTTPQVARIDAHLLNRAGVTRLCYCGPVLHTRPDGLNATREPLQFGIEIADVRIKRVDFAANVTEAVYNRMKSERMRVANLDRATGSADGEKIRADADRQREVIVAEAYRDAQKIKGEGDAQAAAAYSEAFGRDPQFAQFYRSLEAYKQSFNKKSDVMVLDPSSDFFRAMQGSGSNTAAPRR